MRRLSTWPRSLMHSTPVASDFASGGEWRRSIHPLFCLVDERVSVRSESLFCTETSMKRKYIPTLDRLEGRVVLSQVVMHSPVPHLVHHPVHHKAHPSHALLVARRDLAHSRAHPTHGQPLAFTARPSKAAVHTEQTTGSDGFGGGNIDTTIPFILATDVGGVAQNALNFTSNTYHGVLFGFEWDGIEQI